MRNLFFAAALAIGGSAAIAQVPPGNGVTQQGNNPEGQACTPEGFNQDNSAYPPCSALQPRPTNIDEYPACSDRNADRCRQTYTRWTD